MAYFFHPSVHYFVTLVHVTCALFWLGWMVYVSLFVMPLVRRVVPEKFYELRARLQARTRKVVGVFIVLIILTGTYNLEYRGLLNPRVLFATRYGLWVVLKIFLALTLFGFYFAAPRFSSRMEAGEAARGSDPNHRDRGGTRAVFVVVHMVALGLGLTVAYIGISIGG